MTNTNLIKDINFLYNEDCLSIKSDSIINCNGSCDYKTPCNCLIIDNIEVTNLNIRKIVNIIYNSLYNKTDTSDIRELKLGNLLDNDDIINKYCIDRLLKLNAIWDNYSWDFNIENSFYGQKLKGAFLKSVICEDFKILNFPHKQKLDILLYREYKKLPNKGFEYELIKIKKSDVIFDNKFHLEKVMNKDLHFYDNYDLPLGIVEKINDKYSIIDGYHRIYKSNTNYITVFLGK